MFKMKRSVLLFVAVLLTAGLVSGSAQAADAPVLERIVQSGELRVGLSGDQPPFNATDRDGHLIGLEVDLANLLAGALRVEAKLVAKLPNESDTAAAHMPAMSISGTASSAASRSVTSTRFRTMERTSARGLEQGDVRGQP